MKRILYIILIIFELQVYAQTARDFNNGLSYSFVENNEILLLENPEPEEYYMLEINMRSENIPKRTIIELILNSGFSKSWSVSDNYISYLSVFGPPSNIKFELRYDKLDSLNFIQRKKFDKELGRQLQENNDEDEIFDVLIGQLVNNPNKITYKLLVPKYLYEQRVKRKSGHNSDFQASLNLDKRTICVYIRTLKDFTIWNYGLLNNNWKEIKTFSSDSVCNFRHLDKYSPDCNKIVYHSISDSLFFQGHFKAIRQGENTFLINQSHGAIYWIGENAIYKVGQIDLENYKQQLLNQKLFIEDRDNNQIIFFSKVERLNNEYPFPDIQLILSEKDFEKKFGNVLKSIGYLNK
jgi:hypothetical protein